MRPLLLVTALATALTHTCPAREVHAQGASDVPSRTEVFKSDPLHLSYTYPASLQPANALTTLKMAGDRSTSPPAIKKILACVTSPFSGMTGNGGSPASVILYRVDSGCLHLTPDSTGLEIVTSGLVAPLAAGAHGAHVTDPKPFQMGGHEAALITGTIPYSLTPGPLHLALACAANRFGIVCWELIASSADNLAALAANPVQFDGEAPVAVVPAALLAKP